MSSIRLLLIRLISRLDGLVSAGLARVDRGAVCRVLYLAAVVVVAAAIGAATLVIHYPQNWWAAVILAIGNVISTVQAITDLTEQIRKGRPAKGSPEAE